MSTREAARKLRVSSWQLAFLIASDKLKPPRRSAANRRHYQWTVRDLARAREALRGVGALGKAVSHGD
jgi:hypothetical protein